MEFLVFGEDYNRHPSSTQHLINEIKKTYAVQWVNSIGMRKPQINKTDMARVIEKLSGKKEMLYPESSVDSDNLTVVKPIVYPLAENFFLRALNKAMMRHTLKQKEDIKRIVWLTLPSAVDYLEVSEGDFIVYYCCDDFSSLNGVDHEIVAEKEQELFLKADLVFTTSLELYKKFKSRKTYMLPHGVHRMFFDVRQKEVDVEKITLGFYGGIDTRINFDMLKELLDNNQNLELEMVGHLADDVDKSFFSHPRIKKHDAFKHEELVKKINEWDILLLPFLHNGYSEHCNPLKLREYLATGKPIISTKIPAVKEYGDFLKIRESSSQWQEAISDICREDIAHRDVRIQKIRKVLEKETWDCRANDAVKTILRKA